MPVSRNDKYVGLQRPELCQRFRCVDFDRLKNRRAALGFIFVTVLLDMLALGIIVPVMPKLIAGFLQGDIARTSEYMGLFVTTWALMQFAFAPVLGMLSDRFGRRPVILISNFGLGSGSRRMLRLSSLKER